jgi:hypothetical protein
MIDRRGFLAALAAGTAGLVLDPERALWRPGQRTFFLPPVPKTLATDGWSVSDAGVMFRRGDIVTFDGVYDINPRTHRATKHLKKFVVTAGTVSADFAELAIAPLVIPAGAYRNVTRRPKGPARGALVGANGLRG